MHDMIEESGRLLPWDACYNVRDVGGYDTVDGRRTRWGALLRADNLCRLTRDGQAALVAHGVRTIIDLRSPSELALEPHPFAEPAGHRGAPVYLSLSLLDEEDADAQAALAETDTTTAFYCRALDLFPAKIGAAITAVAEAPEGGVLVHCFAGKDRTGLVTAVLLELAGVPRETIAVDYALSDTYLQPLYNELLAPIEDAVEREKLAQQFTSLPKTLLDTLAHLDARYGGVRSYLEVCGVGAKDMERIKDRLCV